MVGTASDDNHDRQVRRRGCCEPSPQRGPDDQDPHRDSEPKYAAAWLHRHPKLFAAEWGGTTSAAPQWLGP
jgi:hypothetical protein